MVTNGLDRKHPANNAAENRTDNTPGTRGNPYGGNETTTAKVVGSRTKYAGGRR